MKAILLLFCLSMISCEKSSTANCTCEETSRNNNGIRNENGFIAYTTMEEAQSCSKQTKKPILVMFTGYGAYSSTNLPWEILNVEEIKDVVEEHYVLLTLYIDDRTKLDSTDSKKLPEGDTTKTIGDKNKYFLNQNFNTVALPLYVIINDDLEPLSSPIGYTPVREKQKFIEFLNVVNKK